MGIEEQIAVRLQQGATARQLLAEGFRKSTVYKVADTLKAQQAPAPAPVVVVQLATDRDRYLPGQVAHASFTVKNQGNADLYIFQAGAWPEWLLPTEWIPTTQRKLISPGDSLIIRLSIPIPPDLTLGEKDLLFGIQGQWVGPQTTSPSSEIMWTTPLILRVQRTLTGTTVFLAHSVNDMSLVSQLESTLDDNGIATAVAASGSEATRTAIAGAQLLVAVITDASRMAPAADEIICAQRLGKDLIIVRDQSLSSLMPQPIASLPWINVDFSLGAASTVGSLFAALTDTIAKRAVARKREQDDALGIVLLALGALAAGVALAKGRGGGLG